MKILPHRLPNRFTFFYENLFSISHIEPYRERKTQWMSRKNRAWIWKSPLISIFVVHAYMSVIVVVVVATAQKGDAIILLNHRRAYFYRKGIQMPCMFQSKKGVKDHWTGKASLLCERASELLWKWMEIFTWMTGPLKTSIENMLCVCVVLHLIPCLIKIKTHKWNSCPLVKWLYCVE